MEKSYLFQHPSYFNLNLFNDKTYYSSDSSCFVTS